MIWYFSATGNSKMIAEILARGTGERTGSIGKALRGGRIPQGEDGDDVLGFVMPVCFWGLSAAVLEFLEGASFRVPEDAYVYAVFAYGSAAGMAGPQLTEVLKKKGIRLDAVFSVRTTDTFVPVYSVRDADAARKTTEAAAAAAEQLVPRVLSKERGDFAAGRMPAPMARAFYKNYGRARETGNFTVGAECAGCGVCERVCPVRAIGMKDGRPVFVKETCALCLACLHRCPNGAIGYRRKNRHGQFVNPFAGDDGGCF